MCSRRRNRRNSLDVMVHTIHVILLLLKLSLKFYKQDFGGKQCSRTPKLSYQDVCQRMGNIRKSNEMPQNFILEVDVFDVWGVHFMGSFLTLSVMNTFLLRLIMFLSGWKSYQAPPMMHKLRLRCSKYHIPTIWNAKSSNKRWRNSLHQQSNHQPL